jgi:hypothetical protein
MPESSQSQPVCLWRVNDPEFNDYWNTDCKEAYNFMHGGPVENMYRYCPGCGRRIKVEVRIEPL